MSKEFSSGLYPRNSTKFSPISELNFVAASFFDVYTKFLIFGSMLNFFSNCETSISLAPSSRKTTTGIFSLKSSIILLLFNTKNVNDDKKNKTDEILTTTKK